MPHQHAMHGVKRQLVFKALNADNKRRIDTLEDQVKKLQEASDRVSQEQQAVRRRLDRVEKSTQLVLENSAEVEELYKTAALSTEAGGAVLPELGAWPTFLLFEQCCSYFTLQGFLTEL